MAPIQLLELPTEILQKICRTLCNHCQETGVEPYWREYETRTSLSRLSRSCQFFRSLAQPILFHAILLQCDDRLGPVYNGMASFVRAVAENPILAQSVRWLTYEDSSDDEADLEVPYFEAQAANVGLSLPPGWADFEGSMRDAVLLILVLQYLPNLTELDVVCWADWDHEALVELASRSPRVANVKDLEIRHSDTEDGFDLEYMTPLTSLFSDLRSLTTQLCVSSGYDPALSSLRTLHLNVSELRYHDLRQLLRPCQQLESFRYRAGAMSLEKHGDEEVAPDEMIEALAPARRSLKRLEIHYEASYRAKYSGNYSGTIKSLPFPNLETVELSLNALYVSPNPDSGGSGETLERLLPASIKNLAIRNADLVPVTDLLGLAEAALSGRFPKLKEVRLVCGGKWRDGIGWCNDVGWNNEQIASVESKFQGTSIRFFYSLGPWATASIPNNL